MSLLGGGAEFVFCGPVGPPALRPDRSHSHEHPISRSTKRKDRKPGGKRPGFFFGLTYADMDVGTDRQDSAATTGPSARARGGEHPHHPRGRRRVRAPCHALLDRQGFVGAPPSGPESVLSGAHSV